MVPHTRRRFLHVAAAAAGGLAGCNQLSGGEAQSTRSATPTESASRGANGGGTASNTATDPPTLLLRADTAMPPIKFVDPDREETRSPRPESFPPRYRHAVVDSESRAERLTVADGVDGSDGSDGNGDTDTVAAFVAETDFDSETIYLESNRVRECFRLKLCKVSWQPTDIHTDYTQQLRPYDEHCEADAHVFESRLIRLPVALDESEVNSYGSSIGGSGRCDPEGGPRAEGSGGSASEDSGWANDSSGASGQATDGGEQ